VFSLVPSISSTHFIEGVSPQQSRGYGRRGAVSGTLQPTVYYLFHAGLSGSDVFAGGGRSLQTEVLQPHWRNN
jgi:hypothetical protein